MPSGFERSLSEENIKAYFEIIRTSQTGTLNEMLHPEFVECSVEEKTLTLCFPVASWETNPEGNLHGGILSSMFDFTMGLLSCFVNAGPMTPTVSMNVNFLSAPSHGDNICVKAVCAKPGRTLCYTTASAWGSSDSTRLIGTAEGIYFRQK